MPFLLWFLLLKLLMVLLLPCWCLVAVAAVTLGVTVTTTVRLVTGCYPSGVPNVRTLAI